MQISAVRERETFSHINTHPSATEKRGEGSTSFASHSPGVFRILAAVTVVDRDDLSGSSENHTIDDEERESIKWDLFWLFFSLHLHSPRYQRTIRAIRRHTVDVALNRNLFSCWVCGRLSMTQNPRTWLNHPPNHCCPANNNHPNPIIVSLLSSFSPCMIDMTRRRRRWPREMEFHSVLIGEKSRVK